MVKNNHAYSRNTGKGKEITFYVTMRQKCPLKGERIKSKKLVIYWSHLYEDLQIFKNSPPFLFSLKDSMCPRVCTR